MNISLKSPESPNTEKPAMLLLNSNDNWFRADSRVIWYWPGSTDRGTVTTCDPVRRLKPSASNIEGSAARYLMSGAMIDRKQRRLVPIFGVCKVIEA